MAFVGDHLSAPPFLRDGGVTCLGRADNIASVAAVTFSITPLANDDRMGKAFIFGLNVPGPVNEPTPQNTGQPRGLL
jgi:hypothetical protein